MSDRVGFGTVDAMPNSMPRRRHVGVLLGAGLGAHVDLAGLPSQSNVTVKQHDVPAGTLFAAATLIHPVQFGGTGFGAGVKSSFSSVAVKPGHRPAIVQAAPDALLQKISAWTWLDPIPGAPAGSVK